MLRHAFQEIDFVLQPQILPALQNDGDVSVLPEEIVEGAEAEFVLFLALRVGEEFVDLQLADLVRNRLTATRLSSARNAPTGTRASSEKICGCTRAAT